MALKTSEKGVETLCSELLLVSRGRVGQPPLCLVALASLCCLGSCGGIIGALLPAFSGWELLPDSDRQHSLDTNPLTLKGCLCCHHGLRSGGQM